MKNSKFASFLTHDSTPAHGIGLLILRLVFALVLIYGHGYGKLSTILSGAEIQFMDPIGIGAVLSFYLAALAEGICAFLLIIGLFSRLASLVLTINFIVIFVYHAFIAGDGFPVLEMRYLYLTVFIVLSITGPGKISLDHLLFKPGRLDT